MHESLSTYPNTVKSHLDHLGRKKWLLSFPLEFGAMYVHSLVPRLSKSARGGEEEESLVSAVYTCASFTQILGKP